MNPEAQRIAIAEACGWTKLSPSAYTHLKRLSGIKPGSMRVVHKGEYIDSYSDVPDYLNDLNAMHEAENVLTPEQRSQFTGWLANKVKRDDMIWDYAHATAAQRAEAFLKAIGKWTTSPEAPAKAPSAPLDATVQTNSSDPARSCS